LEQVAKRRNAVAHDPIFAVPTDGEIRADMLALLDNLRLIVRAVENRMSKADE